MYTKLTIAVTVIAALTAFSGYFQGQLTDRWGKPAELNVAGEFVNDFPKVIGSWHTTSEEQLPVNAAQILQCSGSMIRTYLQQETGETVKVALMVGQPGPMSVHIPEICYRGQNCHPVGDRVKETLTTDSQPVENSVWSVTLQPADLDGKPFKVYYAWNDGRAWHAATQPRVTFGTAKLLYKIQLSADVSTSRKATEPGIGFLSSLVSAGPRFPH